MVKSSRDAPANHAPDSPMTTISSGAAPAAVGPYAQAVQAGDFVFCSGQIGIDPETGALCGSDIASQTAQVFKNIRAVLSAAGLELDSVVKTTLFLADIKDFPVVNELYAREFGDHRPARSTVQVSRLPLDARIELECMAVCRLQAYPSGSGDR